MDIRDLPPDIAENQKSNRRFIREYVKDRTISRALSKLLNDKLHYFDLGYKCELTPEQLDEAIKKEVEDGKENG